MTRVERDATLPAQPIPLPLVKRSLDKDLSKIVRVEQATQQLARRTAAMGLGLVFLIAAAGVASLQAGLATPMVVLIVAAVLGGYMALNIGANDVANNVGPAVGSGALTMMGALVIAAVFEMAGAMIAGGDVVSTISKGIIDPAKVADGNTFVLAMMAALLAAAVWINLATYLRAPVSTTHAIVGGVMGAGVAAAGFGLVNWANMGLIAASWVISPLMGGVVAALFLAFIKVNVIYRPDKLAAARRWVPALLGIMAGAFTSYLITKGLDKVWRPGTMTILLTGVLVMVATMAVLTPWVARKTRGMENRNRSLRVLFAWPLVCSAALLSFAHGANDVANAVGPLAAIIHSASSGGVAAKVSIPLWVMLIGAAGIALGLFLYGPRIIQMVGDEITKMNPMRAFCVALSAALTVIIASGLGLPVSSTHITVGAVFGVGFFREYYTRHSRRRQRLVLRNGMRAALEAEGADAGVDASLDALQRRKLVRRSHFMTIIAAWLITVPMAAVMAGLLYLAMDALI